MSALAFGKVTIAETHDTTRSFRVINGYEYMDVVLRSRPNPTSSSPDNMCHEVMINSSYGAWAFAWGYVGSETWQEWFARLNMDYMMGKLMGSSFTVDMEPDEVWAKAKRFIVNDVKRGRRESPDARRLIQAVRDGFTFGDPESLDEVFDLLNEHDPEGGGSWNAYDFDLTKVNPTARNFWDKLWAPFAAHLKSALAQVEKADG